MVEDTLIRGRTIGLLRYAAIAAVCFAFFLVYAFLPLAAPLRFTSPDETSNLFFSRLFADSNRLWHFDPLNVPAGGLIHPRSVRVVNDFLVPGGFIGLPVLYGLAAKALGGQALPFLTPFCGVLGAVMWGGLVRRFFGGTVGWLAGFLLLAQPAWWYESSRVMMPNVLFATLAIGAAFFFFTVPAHSVLRRFKRDVSNINRLARSLDPALAGVFLGLALAVRPSEAYWLALTIGLMMILRRRELPRFNLIVAAISAAATLVPFLSLQATAYGSVLASGYGDAAAGMTFGAALPGRAAKLLGPLRPFLFPFGLAPRAAFSRFVAYGVAFFPWWSAMVGIGLGLASAGVYRLYKSGRRFVGSGTLFAAASAAASLWLILFYGSWAVQDNPDPAVVTIGSSYLRYWLPIFVFSTAPAAWLIKCLIGPIRSRWSRSAVLIGCCLFVVTLSGRAVFSAPQEGLLVLRRTVEFFDKEASIILAATTPESLIVVDRADKILFPDRSVIYPLRSEETYQVVGRLAGRVPLYYFGITLPESDVRYLQAERLDVYNLAIVPVVTIGQETLYAFKKKP